MMTSQNPIVKNNKSIAKDILNHNKNLTTVNIHLERGASITQSTIITPITIDINSIPITSVKNSSPSANTGRTLSNTSGAWVRKLPSSPSLKNKSKK
ncbi:hypothetical protein [Fictibacillus terranigra]|uniref:Uncharacterized protein n=1 Tax=Fictibacillus terranigra TaxID=3058424 RepID=A0ABT8E3I0_9BACL|nr:hypothetical protein [Fictibacillus sp. CENA-BCM004]MDN4072467.1 hypothetical protein [Fictibacillus sp. CENA-BCM004]